MSEPDAVPESFSQQVRSLGGIYWIANWMELVERFAYYGVRTVLPVFMVLAISDGGPELTHVQKGTVYSIWALVQSFVPIFTGVYADRYGYKINIAISTGLKIVGYLLMGYCIVLAESLAGQPLAEAREAGTDQTYEIFFAGAMFLALGTAIFKPGLQGLIAHQMPTKAASLGWGIFYQMVNIGGFLGPLVAGYLRVLEWEYVFLCCAIGIALNFIPLFLFREPPREGEADERSPWQLAVGAVEGLLEPRLFFFTIAFAGFWLMFYQLFDILPNFIDDWVDSRAAADALQSVLSEDGVPTTNGGNLTQEWMINLNALLISLFAFLVGYLTGRLRSLTAIVIGIAVSAVAIYMLGMRMQGWFVLIAIAVFSVGEMMASPTKMRYLAAIAPPGRQGQYMGYVNMTVGIGWSIGSIVAGELYQEQGDKVVLARRYLIEREGLGVDRIASLDRGDVMAFFQRAVGVDAWEARELLWNTYEPYSMWLLFTLIGLGSMLLLFVYDRVTRKAAEEPSFSFNTHGRRWVQAALGPIFVGLVAACVMSFSGALLVQAVMFGLLLVASFVLPEPEEKDGSAEL
ncbi:MAG TPA: MFS transporter [Sandaracinaceae bacterium LLY-WYZ-13_1]|nr:MFS transporter [Sandaracinaceae bacterium LLY-WYZ-13_1]